ncbi:MAG: hypothetical protein OEU92_10625 [Alphaproteobacteria bacterium]|nr:hypothetical protein [Alphaproteobacteria bacterium]
MSRDDDDQQQSVPNPANNNELGLSTAGEEGERPLSSIPALLTIVRLLARQAAREVHQAANDNRPLKKKRPGE